MKYFKIKHIVSIIAFCIIFLTSCYEGENTIPLENIHDAPTTKIENMMSLVDEFVIRLDKLIEEGEDINSAFEILKPELLADTSIKFVRIGLQGIALEYSDGVSGGIFIDPQDDIGPEPPNYSVFEKKNNQTQGGGHIIQGTPRKKKTILLNPHYYERQIQTESILSIADKSFKQTAFSPHKVLLNEECTLEAFTNLSDYGIIHVYSHGWAFPDNKEINDVYVMCGDEYSKTVAQKYLREINEKQVIIAYCKTQKKWRFFFNSQFFRYKNYFREDSVLMYGGFCYSWLGNWKNTIVDDMGAGAYIGFDWSVYTKWNAFWAAKMYSMMNDTSQAEPVTLDRWHNGIDQNYYSSEDKKNVTVWYKGSGSLTLWGDLFLNILPNPLKGEIDKQVSFNLSAEGSLPKNYRIEWTFGDGSETTTMVNDLTVVHTFGSDGEFQVRAMMYNKDSGDYIGEAVSKAQIGELPPGIEACDYVTLTLFCNEYFSMSTVDEENQFKSLSIVNQDVPIVWNGKNFTVTYDITKPGTSMKTVSYKGTISGTVSDDNSKLINYSSSEIFHGILQNDMGYRHLESAIDVAGLDLISYTAGTEYRYKASGIGIESNISGTKFNYEYFDKISSETKAGSLQKINWSADDFIEINFWKN